MKHLLLFFLLIPIIGSAQINYKEEAKKDLDSLKTLFTQKVEEFNKAKDSLKNLTENLSPTIANYYQEVIKFKKSSDSIFNASKISWQFYAQKGVNKDTLNSVFKMPINYAVGVEDNEQDEKKVEDNKTYLLFGDDRLVLKKDIIKDSLANEIFRNVLKSDSEAHLGDFWFPKNNQKIILSKWNKCPRNVVGIKKEDDCEDYQTYASLSFNKIEIDLYEGSLVDVKVYLKDSDGNTHLFENRRSISLLHYTTTSQRFYLVNKAQQTYIDNSKSFKDYTLRLSDVLRYFSKPGRNYIPDNQSFTFPLLSKGEKTNENSPNIYELRQSTGLENVLDLRAYTDFLGLFGESANGIAQFEGQADFFVNPFRFRHTNIFGFKKIKPYVSYARLDEDDRFLDLTEIDTVSQTRNISNRLDHLQRSYLDLGVKLDVISFNLGKEYPFDVSIYGSARYQIARVKTDSINAFNYKTLGAGFGANFGFKRFDNFDFRYSIEYTKYNQDSYNNIEGISDPNDFWVFRNEAEISYFPSSARNNAIFVRLKVLDDLDSEEGSNFFQFQFGYKFTVGLQKIKGKI